MYHNAAPAAPRAAFAAGQRSGLRASLVAMPTIDVAATGHKLESRLTRHAGPRGDQLAVVAPPHPLYGGSIGNPVVRAMEARLGALGLSTLAFNFRGTGDSTGEPSGDLADGLVDYVAAARAGKELTLSLASGYSFGSCAALMTAIKLDVPRVLMVAPPLALLDPVLLERYRGQLLVLVGSDDDYAPEAELRETFARAPQTRIELLPEVDHFFLGSAVQKLSAGLDTLLEPLL